MIKDFSNIKSVYMIGIKGAGMAALAQMLGSRNITVAGSDTTEKFHTDASLKGAAIKVIEGFSEDNIPDTVDVVIHSTVYTQENNPEMVAAKRRDITILTYPQALGMLMQDRFGIAVAGTHGKTTITALLAHTLKEAGSDPSAIVGAYVPLWRGGALTGRGKYFVMEADEYQNKLQYYDPLAVIFSNVDYDHPDFFPTHESYKQVFADFIARVPRHGFVVMCGDDEGVLEASKSAQCSVVTYGFSDSCDFCIVHRQVCHDTESQILQRFDVIYRDKKHATIELMIPGEYNACNAAAVIAMSEKLGIAKHSVVQSMQTFSGTARRFEYKGQKGGILYYDDYAHHPVEVDATLRAARAQFPKKKLWAIFHPHTFTRTKEFLHEFARSLDHADHVIILDIYGSAREEHGGVSAEDLVAAINQDVDDKAVHMKTIENAAAYVQENAPKDSVVFTIGAGDVFRLHEMIK